MDRGFFAYVAGLESGVARVRHQLLLRDAGLTGDDEAVVAFNHPLIFTSLVSQHVYPALSFLRPS